MVRAVSCAGGGVVMQDPIGPIDPEDIIRSRLGPPPLEVLRKAAEECPDMQSVVVVIQREDGSLQVRSGGNTVLETAGMLGWAQYYVNGAVEGS